MTVPLRSSAAAPRPAPDGEVLRVEDLNLTFRLYEGDAHVLKDVSFHVNPGEHVALVGESGCGKSVTLRVILGLLDPRRARITGTVRYQGRPLRPADYPRLRGQDITMIFQDPMASLNPTFTIGDQLGSIIRRGQPRLGRNEVRRVAADALKKVAIADPERVLDAYPFQLSGGLNQRVLITMALVNHPKLILADEPGTALDVTVQKQTLDLMEHLVEQNDAAVLLITHNLGVVREFAHRIYVMYAGMIVETGTTNEIFHAPKHPYTQALFASVPRLTGEALPSGIEGTVPDYTRPPSGCRFHPRCPYAMPKCTLPVPDIALSPTHRVKCVLYEGTPA